MPRYQVTIREELLRSAVLEADSKAEAKDLASQMFSKDYDYFKDTCDYGHTVTDVERIKDADDCETFLPDYDKEEIKEILNEQA